MQKYFSGVVKRADYHALFVNDIIYRLLGNITNRFVKEFAYWVGEIVDAVKEALESLDDDKNSN